MSSKIDLLRAGDEQTVLEVQQYIHKVCKSIMKADYEDASQSAFLKVWESLDKFKGKSSLLTWVNQIAANECYTLLRKGKMDSLSEDLVDLKFEDTDNLQEHLNELERALGCLDEKHRVALEGKLDGKPAKTLAKEMGITVNHLWQIQFNARQKLKEICTQ